MCENNVVKKNIDLINSLYKQKKSLILPFLIIFFTFLFFSVPGVIYFLKVQKNNLKVNKKINEVLKKYKNETKIYSELISYNQEKIEHEFYVEKKKMLLLLFGGVVVVLLFFLILIMVLVIK